MSENKSGTITRREALMTAGAAVTTGALLGRVEPVHAKAKSDPGTSWLLHNGPVLTMNADMEIIDDGAVAVVDGRIAAVGQSRDLLEAYPDLTRKDAKGAAILPGFVNCHCHSESWMNKGVVTDMLINDHTEGRTFARMSSRGHRDTPHDYISVQNRVDMAMLGNLDMLKNGVTANLEVGSHDPEASAICELGTRLCIGENVWDAGAEGFSKGDRIFDDKERVDGLKRMQALYDKWHSHDDGRITVHLSAWKADVCSLELQRDIAQLAEELDTIVHIHCGQAEQERDAIYKNYKMNAAELMQESGILNPRTICGHAATLTNPELRILGEAGVSIGYCAYKHLIYGGMTRALPLQEAGANITIGTDDQGDFIGAVRAALCLARLQQGTEGYRVQPMEMLRWSTINGAKALRLDHEIGSLEVGKSADIITFDLSQPHMQPVNDVAAAIVHYGVNTDVKLSAVRGRILMENREVKTVDEAEIVDKARYFSVNFWNTVQNMLGERKVPKQPPIVWNTSEVHKYAG